MVPDRVPRSVFGQASMRAHRAGDHAQAADQQHQHDDGVEQAGRLKIDVHVGDHAGDDEQRAGRREQPADHAPAIEEQQPDADQHRDQGNAEGTSAIEAPVRSAYRDLIRQQVSTETCHGEAEEEMSDAAGRAAHVAEIAVCHPNLSIPSGDASLLDVCNFLPVNARKKYAIARWNGCRLFKFQRVAERLLAFLKAKNASCALPALSQNLTHEAKEI
jgi:hypothetical protein